MYIVIEMQGGAEFAAILTDEDGSNIVLSTREEAEVKANECQDALIIEC